MSTAIEHGLNGSKRI